MTPEFLTLLAASFVLGAAIAYLWWCHVRVTFLREDLFMIRDRLWDQARQHDMLEDPAYLRAREVLNATIGIAGLFSVRMFDMIRSSPQPEVQHSPPLPEGEKGEVIREAYEQMKQVIIDYVYFRTFTGQCRVFKEFFKFYLRLSFIPAVRGASQMASWLESRGPVTLNEFEKPSHHQTA